MGLETKGCFSQNKSALGNNNCNNKHSEIQKHLNCSGKCMLRMKSSYVVPPNPSLSSNCNKRVNFIFFQSSCYKGRGSREHTHHSPESRKNPLNFDISIMINDGFCNWIIAHSNKNQKQKTQSLWLIMPKIEGGVKGVQQKLRLYFIMYSNCLIDFLLGSHNPEGTGTMLHFIPWKYSSTCSAYIQQAIV